MIEQVPAVNTPIATLLDNRPGTQMLDAIRRLIAESASLNIATGFFEVDALLDLDSHWQQLDHIRLFMGVEVTRRTRNKVVKAIPRKDMNVRLQRLGDLTGERKIAACSRCPSKRSRLCVAGTE